MSALLNSRSARHDTHPTPHTNWDWQNEAACRGEDLDLFFGPARETPPEREARETKALSFCQQCPVQDACLNAALAHTSQWGVQGGMTEDQRTQERRRRLRRAKTRETREHAKTRAGKRAITCGHCGKEGFFSGKGPNGEELVESCHSRWTRHGKPDHVPNPPNPDRKRARVKTAAQLKEQGLDARAIAKRLGVTAGYVRDLLRDAFREEDAA